MWFKFLCWLGKKIPDSGLPLCRVYNDAKTEHYTLQNDGWVICQGVGQTATDALPIMMVSEKLQQKFAAALDENQGAKDGSA